GVDSDIFRSCTFNGVVPEASTMEADVRDAPLGEELHETLRTCDAVIHLAGLSNDPLGDYRPGLTNEINRLASVGLAKAAKAAGVTRFVFASSCSNYGAAGDDFLTEASSFNPVTPYGRSKADVEHDVAPLADESFSPVFLRASTAYGLSPRIRFDLVVNNLTAWAYTTGEVHLKSDGSSWRPIVHVEDIARAYIAVIEADRDLVHNEAFNVGTTTENYLVKEIAEIVRDVVPGSRIGFADGATSDKRNYRVDCTHIAKKLSNFKPQWTCRRGVEELYGAFCDANLKLEEFEGERFMRIAHVKSLIEKGALDDTLRWTAEPSARTPS
ncbi:MAG: SDR family oxidoreductase, partial [Pseudomonadota bacterium]